jgi:hypothetical protein
MNRKAYIIGAGPNVAAAIVLGQAGLQVDVLEAEGHTRRCSAHHGIDCLVIGTIWSGGLSAGAGSPFSLSSSARLWPGGFTRRPTGHLSDDGTAVVLNVIFRTLRLSRVDGKV